MVQNTLLLRHTGMNHGGIVPQLGMTLLPIQYIYDQTSCTLLLGIPLDTLDLTSSFCTFYTHCN